MKISEIITDKYKLRIPPTVYYELLADVQEVEEEQELKTGHWKHDRANVRCSNCGRGYKDAYGRKSAITYNFCPNCGCRMVEPQESEG